MMKMALALVATAALMGCASTKKEADFQQPTPMSPQANAETAETDREVASSRCLFDLEESEARRIRLYYRKARSFSSDDIADVKKLSPYYKRMIEHYMRTARGWKGGSEDRMFDEYLSGDGGYVQRIVWGKGSSRRTFIDVSHYPGDNHYGVVYEVTSNKPVPVLAIHDGDFENCRVTVPEGTRPRN